MFFSYLRADVQTCRGICHSKPERNKVLYVVFFFFCSFSWKRLTVPEILLLAAFQQRCAGRREHSARGEIS